MNWLTIALHAAVFLFGATLFLPVGIYSFRAPAFSALRLPQLFTAAVGGTVAVLCFLRFGLCAEGIMCLVFLALLTAVALRDIITLEISDWLNAAIATLGVVAAFLTDTPELLSRIIGLFCVSVPLLLLTLLIPDAFGGGDIKLMAACGLFLGWRGNLLAAFIAILLGGLWGVGLLLLKKKKGKEHFAFGPFLCAGAALCAFFGDIIVSLFLKVFDLTLYI